MIPTDLMEVLKLEARDKYFIDNCKEPFLILCDSFGVIGKSNKFSLYFADLARWDYKKLADAKQKINQFVEESNRKGKNIYVQKLRQNKKQLVVIKNAKQN